MKFSRATTTTLLVGSTSLALSSGLDVRPPRQSFRAIPSSMTTQLQYMDKAVDVDTDGVVDMGAAITQMNVEDDDDKVLVESLAFSLNIDDEFLNKQYQTWLHKYNKTPDSSRFFNWKRNYLMQEVWNRTNGETFDLNEFGDFTKQEFEAMKKTNDSIVTENEDGPANVLPSAADHASHAYYFDDGEKMEEAPKRKFKQVKTFSGGFRMVPCTEPETTTQLVAAMPVQVQPTTSTSVSVDKKGTPTAAEGQRFRKVRLFSGGFMIVPNTVKN